MGIWANATSNSNPNIVVAGFNRLGCMFYYITNKDLIYNPIIALTATAIWFKDIFFRIAY